MPMCLHVIFDLEADVVAPLLNWHADGDDDGDELLLSGGVGLKKIKIWLRRKATSRKVVCTTYPKSLQPYSYLC